MQWTRALSALVVACLGAAVAAAQQTQQPKPTFRTAVDLVQVDVVVLDGDGRHVRNLKASDFTLLDRRKPQEIAAFDEVAHERAADAPPPLPPTVKLDVADNRTAQADRLIVMVVDDLHIVSNRTDKTKAIARDVLDKLAPQSSMAVLFTSGYHSTQVTEDRALLASAIETMKGRQSWRRPHPAIDRQTGTNISPEMSAEQQQAIISANQSVSLQDFFDNMTQYKTLEDAARMLGGNDLRRKAFVLVSEGIGKDLSGLFGTMAPPGDAPQGGAAYAAGGGLGTLTEIAPQGYHAEALIAMMESLRRSNVATYAIDPRGLVKSSDLARECWPPPSIPDPCSSGLTEWESVVRQAQHGLEMISEASGGFAVTNTDDFTGGLDRIVADLDHYYLLGFYPDNPKGNKYRRLEVQVAGHPDWKLHFRRGYIPSGAPPPPKNPDPLVALSAGILPKTDLPLRLTAIPLPPVRAASAAAAKTTRVALALEVTARVKDLQDADYRLRDTLKYEVLVVDEAKKKVTSASGLSGRVTLSPGGDGDVPESVAYQVATVLEVPPGRYQLRVSATSDKQAKGGSVYLNIDVPDFSAAPLALSGLALGYADGPHVPVAPASAAPGQAAGPALPFPPSLDRTFAVDALRLYCEIASSVRPVSPKAVIEIRSATGQTSRAISPDLAPGDRVIDTHVPIGDLPAGAYVLRVSVADQGRTATREIGFVVTR
jgi:VWFA-related protein